MRAASAGTPCRPGCYAHAAHRPRCMRSCRRGPTGRASSTRSAATRTTSSWSCRCAPPPPGRAHRTDRIFPISFPVRPFGVFSSASPFFSRFPVRSVRCMVVFVCCCTLYFFIAVYGSDGRRARELVLSAGIGVCLRLSSTARHGCGDAEQQRGAFRTAARSLAHRPPQPR